MAFTRIRAPLCALLGTIWVAACATPSPPPAPEAPAAAAIEYPSEVAASSAFLRGRQLELDGRLLEAAEAYEEAARFDPDSARLQGQLAGVWVRVGQPERAVIYAKRAYELDPGDDRMRANLASLYVNMRRWEDAVALLEPPFLAGELETAGLFSLFDLYLRLGRHSAAMRVGEEMIAEDPNDLRAVLRTRCRPRSATRSSNEPRRCISADSSWIPNRADSTTRSHARAARLATRLASSRCGAASSTSCRGIRQR